MVAGHELEESRNPVASLILAHLAARRTRTDPALRLGLQRRAIRQAFGFIDRLLRLPDELRNQFVQQLRAFEENRQMTYITSIEELGIEKGIEKGIEIGRVAGLIDGITLALDLKFGDAAAPSIAEIRQLSDLALLEAILVQIKTAATLEDVRRIYAPAP